MIENKEINKIEINEKEFSENAEQVLKMFDRFESFLKATNQINKAIQKIKTREMKEFGLKGGHVMCLFQLRRHGGVATQAELVEWCNEDKAAISRTIGELEERQLIVYEDGTTGNKKYKLQVLLTKKGEDITEKMGGKIMDAVETASQGYTKAQRDMFYDVLFQVASNLQKASREK